MDRFVLHDIYSMSAEDRKRFNLGRYADDGSLLEDTVTGEIYLDGWEPEDATFIRDLGWVPVLLNTLAEETATARRERDALRVTIASNAELFRVANDQQRADLEELRLILAAEQGKAEGAPSEGWRPAAGGGAWLKGKARVKRGARSWYWYIYKPAPNDFKETIADGDASTARAAMLAADAALASTPAADQAAP